MDTAASLKVVRIWFRMKKSAANSSASHGLKVQGVGLVIGVSGVARSGCRVIINTLDQ